MNKKVGLCKIVWDLVSLVGSGYWILSLIIFISSLLSYTLFIKCICMESFANNLINCIPTIIGFLIAAMAIIMGLNEKAIDRLSKQADDNEIPLMVVVASITICIIHLLFLLLLSFFTNNSDDESLKRVLGFFVLYLTFESIKSIIHVVLHLFATTTHLISIEK